MLVTQKRRKRGQPVRPDRIMLGDIIRRRRWGHKWRVVKLHPIGGVYARMVGNNLVELRISPPCIDRYVRVAREVG